MGREFPYFRIAIFTIMLAAIAFVNGWFLPKALSEKIIGLIVEHLAGIRFTFSGIFLNNLAAAAVLFAGGFLLALPSFFSYYFNFMVLGAVFGLSVRTVGFARLFLSIAPHGIFEIPAIMLSFALGISVAVSLFQAAVLKREIALKKRFWNWARIFLAAVVPLLALAALIEVHATPWLLKNL